MSSPGNSNCAEVSTFQNEEEGNEQEIVVLMLDLGSVSMGLLASLIG